jgi:hypothetical protein
MLADIDKEHIDMAITALKWLVIAERPLELGELAEAVALGLEPRADFDIDNRLPDLTDILRILGSLIAVEVHRIGGQDSDYDSDSYSHFLIPASNSDSDSDKPKPVIVGLAHFSVREYLVSTLPKPWSTNHFNEVDLHGFATKACLNYIQFIASETLMLGDLRSYAQGYWYKHAQKCKNHDRTNSAKLIAPFLNSWRWREASTALYLRNRNDLSTPIIYASLLDLDHVCKLLVDEYNSNVNETIQVEAYTPIQIAIFFGNMEDVHEIIEGTTDIELESTLDSALKLAARKGSAYLLELLTVVLMGYAEGRIMTRLLADSTPIPDIDGQPWWTPFFEALLPSINDQFTLSLRTKLFESPDWQPSILWRYNAGMNIVAAVAHQGSVEAVRQLYEIITDSLGRRLLTGRMIAWALRSPIHSLEKVQLLRGRIVFE